jgi:8-oxo-dGTP pyrophosphatase MutT (NUDIX family)
MRRCEALSFLQTVASLSFKPAADGCLKEQPMNMSRSEPFDTGADGCLSQVAALCWRMHKGHVQILLITSRDTGRWVIPKGWPMNGLTDAAAAAREAWEEAGVEGKVKDAALGQFEYDKVAKADVRLKCLVSVHGLKVQALKARYPEAGQRRRAWFSAETAATLVAEPQLQDLLRQMDAQPDLLRSSA